MPRLRFWAVEGDDTDADGGFIEVLPGGLVRVTPRNAWMLESTGGGGSGLAAPEAIGVPGSPTTRPARGFIRVGAEGDGTALYRAEPVDGWDGARWLDRLRYHFRTPYLRPGEVEFDAVEEGTPAARSIDPSTGRIDTAVDLDQPDDDEVDPVDYWFATGEGWDDIPPDRQVELLRILGIAPEAEGPEPASADGDGG